MRAETLPSAASRPGDETIAISDRRRFSRTSASGRPERSSCRRPRSHRVETTPTCCFSTTEPLGRPARLHQRAFFRQKKRRQKCKNAALRNTSSARALARRPECVFVFINLFNSQLLFLLDTHLSRSELENTHLQRLCQRRKSWRTCSFGWNSKPRHENPALQELENGGDVQEGLIDLQ